MDARFKPWAIHTGKVAGITALGAVVGVLGQEVAGAYFAANPYAQMALMGLAFAGGLVAKSPYFKGAKK